MPKTLLVVDDDDLVRAVTVRMSKRLGYEVLEANGVSTALELSRSHPEITLLLSDVSLADGDGPALFEQLKKERPDLRALFISGSGATEGVLLKPFMLEDLAARIRDLVG